MPKTQGELPDVDAETLNAMIADIAHEIGCPYWASPDLVELDHIPGYIYGGNIGCKRTALDEYKEGQKWRRRVLDALRQQPEWVRQWVADADLDRRIETLCAAKGLRFAPYECPPWMVRTDEELPDPQDSQWYQSARLAQRLRRELEAELLGTDDRPEVMADARSHDQTVSGWTRQDCRAGRLRRADRPAHRGRKTPG